MKKVISTQGLTFGSFTDERLSTAIKERVCPRLEHCFGQLTCERVLTYVSLSFTVMNREITRLCLGFSIDAPTHERLSLFRDACNIFFCLDGFIADDEGALVFFSASDLYDIGRLSHALDVMSVSLESVLCVTDEELIDGGAIYTPSGNTIVQVPNVPRYRIREGTTHMAPSALQKCPCLRQLDIPLGMTNHQEILASAPKVKYKEWTTLYDGSLPDDDEDDDDEEDDDYNLDEHHVAYSKDGKRLLFARIEFHEPRYAVPNGVETIADFAFGVCQTYLTLSVPRSVRYIGDQLFGTEGGHIIIRD